jgi:hypothetical protein
MLDHAHTLVAAASCDRTLEPLREAILSTVDDARELKRAYEGACKTIADMHEAAMGEVCGPARGVVEDVQDLRTAVEIISTSDTFFRKAASDAISRIDTLERELTVIRTLVKQWISAQSIEEAASAVAALHVFANEE